MLVFLNVLLVVGSVDRSASRKKYMPIRSAQLVTGPGTPVS